MEVKETAHAGGGATTMVVTVALNGGSKSKHVVRWALEKFVHGRNVAFKLLHVFPKITGVPTPMGNLIPLPQVRDDVAAAYKKEVEWQKNEMLLPYQKMCTCRKVPTEILLIESDEVANAISTEIAKDRIKNLVIGASSNGLFSRRIKGQLLSSVISECAPRFCTVYVVSKGKLESLRPSDSEPLDECSNTTDSANSPSRNTSSTLDPGSTTSESPFASLPPGMKRLDPLASTISNGNACHEGSKENTTDLFHSFKSLHTTQEDATVEYPVDHISSANNKSSNAIHCESWISEQINIDLELEKLRIELRHIRGMYAIAQNETKDATQRINELSKLRLEEAIKLKEISDKEEKAKELAKHEKEKAEAAKREAKYARECAQREAFQRREAEIKAAREAKENEKLKHVFASPVYQYRTFSWEEIIRATSNFSDQLKIGKGSYGTVYKCRFHHTTLAIKVLHSKDGPRNKQFHQELEILSRIRHPHLLLLLGACPDHGCLVYEYMENGSLEDRLFRKNNTPSIPWFERFRIAWEVASALAFLHNTKPKPIIHRDLKPANILLDHNFISKIGDAGLCTVLNLEPSETTTTRSLYRDTNPVGTLCYIDPEYQRTGLISTKSDVYALGMVILQLLTAKPAVGIANLVEDAISEGHLTEILDGDAGKWPVRETAELALLGVQCAELRRRDRPDLKDNVIPALEKLKDVADRARDLAAGILVAPPSHFICPILQAVMEDPCVAADGYTYDRRAIEMWLKENDTSPTTNFSLSNKNLVPNYTLLYAIMEWKSRRRRHRHHDSSRRK